MTYYLHGQIATGTPATEKSATEKTIADTLQLPADLRNQLANAKTDFLNKIPSLFDEEKMRPWIQDVLISIANKDDESRKKILRSYIGTVCHTGDGAVFASCAADNLIDTLNSEATPDDAKDAKDLKVRKLTQMIMDLIHFADLDKNKTTPAK